ncbi:HU family DNA-binding protein [Desulfosarcina sp. OttesenSCG-928-A07]|nr:HU family DNA-binding protein [Desulfosarcina sp. OttesenSCG-928-G17]MDL2328925.1 HU family DNA-binding protein [Desulfosarcina sp. OttesenSCG-928-A07]
MNKGDLVIAVANAKLVSTKKQAQETVDYIFNAMAEALKKDGSVQIAGFGSFKVTKREARTGRNPQTGAEIKIAARNALKFTPAKALKDAIN